MCQATENPRTVRARLKLNQTEFWRRVGVTQSAGSRYESGRPIPRPLATLLTIAYGTDRQSRNAVGQLRGGSQ